MLRSYNFAAVASAMAMSTNTPGFEPRSRKPTHFGGPITVPPLTEGQRHRLRARITKFEAAGLTPPRHLSERLSR